MSSASVVVVRSVSTTCHGEDLATRQTNPVPAPTRSAMTGSVSARPPAFLVAPKATNLAPASASSPSGGPLEKLPVLRVGARPTALDVLHAEAVELLGDPELVGNGEGEPSAWLPSRSVVSNISTEPGVTSPGSPTGPPLLAPSSAPLQRACSTQGRYRSTWPRTAAL